jgi:RHS repeat-associated protein
MRRAFFFIVAIFVAVSSFASIPRAVMLDRAADASALRDAPAETRIWASDVLAPFTQPGESGLTRALRQAYEQASMTNTSGSVRFLSVDPVMPVEAMRSPQLWNRYSYVGNNPMNRVDPTGKILEFFGSTDDLNKVKAIANSGLHGYQLNIDKNGVASLSKVKATGKETKEQKAFREGLQRVIGDKGTTAINVASHAPGVVIGQFGGPAGHTIDPTDMEKFGSAQPSAASTLGHEVMEQYAGQVLGMTQMSAAHAWAIQQENTFTGWTRGGQTPTQWLPNGLAYGDVFYSRGKETIDVRVTVDPRTFDVTSVTRTPVP